MKFVPSTKRTSTKLNLYMKNFKSTFTKEDCEKWIEEKFAPKGEVTCKGVYIYKKNEEEKFFAFVSFKEEEAAKNIVEELKDFKFEGQTEEEKFYICFAQSKRERKAQLMK